MALSYFSHSTTDLVVFLTFIHIFYFGYPKSSVFKGRIFPAFRFPTFQFLSFFGGIGTYNVIICNEFVIEYIRRCIDPTPAAYSRKHLVELSCSLKEASSRAVHTQIFVNIFTIRRFGENPRFFRT